MIRDLQQTIALRLAAIPRPLKQVLLLTFDFVALAAALWGSYLLRYSAWSVPDRFEEIVAVLTAPAVAIPIFIRMGLYRAVVRFLPERAFWRIIQAMMIATVCWVLVMFLAETAWRGNIPRSVPIIYFVLGSAVVGGGRFVAQALLGPGRPAGALARPVLIYGAAEAGAQLAASLRRTHYVVGFIDDSPAHHGRDVGGVRVYSSSHLEELVRQYGVREVILSMTSLSPTRRREIVSAVAKYHVKVLALPHISDLAAGKYLVSQIREIDIDELLSRSSVPADTDLVRSMIEGRSVMVTGAGGSIGSELCRLIAKWLWI